MESNSSSFLLSKLLDLIQKEIQSDRVLVFLANGKNQMAFNISCDVIPDDKESIPRKIIERALKEKQLIVLDGLKMEPGMENKRGSLKSVICLPLMIGRQPLGAVYLDRISCSGSFSKKNLEFLIAISKPICFVLKNNFEIKENEENEEGSSFPFLEGRSRAFRHILTLINRVKNNNTPVFISGESGTGKELVAKTIHHSGARRKGKFVAVNCGAIPDYLLESELFGHVKGAFTGAVRDKIGLIEEASEGTFFLDEVGDLSFPLQAKLLRLLQEGEIRRIGENQSRFMDVRFISATNKNIEKELECGNFREDLYYRLKIITIEIPPLRERKEDLYFLLNHFLEKYCREMKRERAYFSPLAMELLMSYSWRGNVRELQNEIQRCLILSGEDDFIREEYLSPQINPRRERTSISSSYNFFQARAEFEKRFLNQALARWNYNRKKTAESVGISRQGLFKLIKKHKIDFPKKSSLLSSK